MAIKDQCVKCRLFEADLCKLNGTLPRYDQTSCAQYIKRGICLEKRDEVSSQNAEAPVPDETSQSQNDTSASKRGLFQHPFSFKGRIRRLEYGLSFILCYVYSAFVGLISGEDELAIYILLVPCYWFSFSQGAKRCHDRGNSGWYQIIPFYGLWLLFGDSDKGDNEYGPNPKGEN